MDRYFKQDYIQRLQWWEPRTVHLLQVPEGSYLIAPHYTVPLGSCKDGFLPD